MSRSQEQNEFYWSKEWRRLRQYIMEKYNYICVKCGKVADIVHHVEWIDESNINNPNITLNEENLVPLCIECHNNIHNHKGFIQDDLTFDESGNPIPIHQEKNDTGGVVPPVYVKKNNPYQRGGTSQHL